MIQLRNHHVYTRCATWVSTQRKQWQQKGIGNLALHIILIIMYTAVMTPGFEIVAMELRIMTHRVIQM